MKVVGIISLGCCKNLTDSENLLGVLKSPNITFSNRMSDCDLIIINTCGFIESAKKETIETIDDVLKQKKEDAKVVVCGCFATRYKDRLICKYKDKISAILSIKEYDNARKVFEELLGIDLTVEYNIIDKLYLTNPYFAYIKIGDGCTNRCTYCAIPLIRGTLVSYPKEEILQTVKDAVSNSRNEIVLVAQDTTGYGTDCYKDYRLHNLIEDILKIDGVRNVRLLYLYPDELSDELIDLASRDSRLIPYFDLPLQHASNKILKAMNRRGTKEDIIELLTKIRNKVPNSIIRTTMIVGFPGETEEDFNELLKFIEDYPFDLLGAFTYSREENTYAYNLEQIDETIKNDRLERLMNKQDEISLKLNQKRIGNEYEVRVDLYNPIKRVYRGFSYMSAPDNIDGYVYFTSDERLQRGSLVNVKITDANSHDLFGKII